MHEIVEMINARLDEVWVWGKWAYKENPQHPSNDHLGLGVTLGSNLIFL